MPSPKGGVSVQNFRGYRTPEKLQRRSLSPNSNKIVTRSGHSTPRTVYLFCRLAFGGGGLGYTHHPPNYYPLIPPLLGVCLWRRVTPKENFFGIFWAFTSHPKEHLLPIQKNNCVPSKRKFFWNFLDNYVFPPKKKFFWDFSAIFPKEQLLLNPFQKKFLINCTTYCFYCPIGCAASGCHQFYIW